MVPVIEVALSLLGLYLALGLIFAIPFHAAGLTRIDPAAKGAGWFFRTLITPGIIALWPILLLRWRRTRAAARVPVSTHGPLTARGLRSFHRRLTFALAIAVPLLAGAGIVFRPGKPEPGPARHAILPEPGQLTRVLATHERPFEGLPIDLLLRAEGPESAQIELEIAEDLEIPNLMLYWTDDEASFPASATFLGSVWGPGTRRYGLDPARARRDGSLVLYSLTWQERIASFRLPRE